MIDDALSTKRTDLWIISITLYVLPFFNGMYLPFLRTSHTGFWFTYMIQWLVVPIAILAFMHCRKHLFWKEIGFSPSHTLSFHGLEGLHLLFMAWLLPKAYFLLWQYFISLFPSGGHDFYTIHIPSSPFWGLIISFVFAALSASVEEVHFHGFIIALMRSYRIPSIIIVPTVAILFGAIHWEGGMALVLTTMCFSMIEATYVTRFRFMQPLILGHFITDFIIYLQWWLVATAKV